MAAIYPGRVVIMPTPARQSAQILHVKCINLRFSHHRDSHAFSFFLLLLLRMEQFQRFYGDAVDGIWWMVKVVPICLFFILLLFV